MSISPEIRFDEILANIRVKLPIQNPLHSFVHNNILLMFEKKDFHEALAEAGALYRARTYWTESRYREKYAEGKIIEQDILQGIDHYLSHYSQFEFTEKLGLSQREFLYRLMFSELNFNDEETQPDIGNQHLWDLCTEKMSGQSIELKRSNIQWRAKDYWEKYYNESVSASTHPFIIRLVSSYLDQGQSFWANPFSNKGFRHFFQCNVASIKNFSFEWVKILGGKLEKYEHISSEEIIQKELTLMGIPAADWERVLLEILFDLKGWAGMVNKLEVEPWQATVKAPDIKLVDYIMALLLIERSLDEYHSQLHSVDLAMVYGRQETKELKSFHLSLAIYQITQSLKLEERWMHKLSVPELLQLIEEIDIADHTHRIRLWHEAYEHHYYFEALRAVTGHEMKKTPDEASAEAQVFTCMDDREESIRRHIEETAPKIITYGVLGFFGLDMKFSGVKSQRLIAQCPPVVTARRIVKEVPQDSKSGLSFEKFNKLRGDSHLQLYYNSRTLVRGSLSTIFLGLTSLVPMLLQVFFPKHSKRIAKQVFNLLSPEPVTDIRMDRVDEDHGYSKAEMAKIVETYIKMSGLRAFSRLVILLGHGSTSTNNPFKQAYGCGACGGNAAVPNSRTFGRMANDPTVREELKKNGIHIPDTTLFISAFHDTCTDDVIYFDQHLIPATHLREANEVKEKLQNAAKLNSFERCQRFSLPEAKSSPESAFKHVHERGEDLAQPRPEYGHNMNALAIVGRRELTKGLFLNRRAFLLNYNWEDDPTGEVMAGIVLGGIPVACNINMDYYFSCVDNDNFGCGSKLPLNLTSLLGVMTGSQSDLRIGLARQMVEIHEPIRNMTIIEAPLERVKKLVDNHPRMRNIVYQHWIRLVVKDPETNTWYLFGEKEFKRFDLEKTELKHFKSSMELLNKIHAEEDFAEIGQ